jgi:hypothetical protein
MSTIFFVSNLQIENILPDMWTYCTEPIVLVIFLSIKELAGAFDPEMSALADFSRFGCFSKSLQFFINARSKFVINGMGYNQAFKKACTFCTM